MIGSGRESGGLYRLNHHSEEPQQLQKANHLENLIDPVERIWL